jgi:hypothetical protein
MNARIQHSKPYSPQLPGRAADARRAADLTCEQLRSAPVAEGPCANVMYSRYEGPSVAQVGQDD